MNFLSKKNRSILVAFIVTVSLALSSITVSAGMYFVHADQVGAPTKLSDSNARVVWRAENRGYGEGIYNDDPDGNGRRVTMPVRYPGQYFDNESGLHYNYFRYYDPKLGRYITSDPIGLAGGINTYEYVGGNPLTYIDPLGLAECTYSISGRLIQCTGLRDGKEVTKTVGPDGVFSGMEPFQNDPAHTDKKEAGPVPPGSYDMLRTDKYGGSYWLDEGVLRRLFSSRSEFFMHKGSTSLGCITVDKENPQAMEKWDDLMDFLEQENENKMDVVP